MLDIKASTGESISINTVKRMLGILPYDSAHRKDLLDIVAKYLGYTAWDVLSHELNNTLSGFNMADSMIEMATLKEGQRVIVEWLPDRVVELIHKGNGEYEVTMSRNSKLQEGDLLQLTQLAAGFPFYVRSVKRKGINIGNYTAAMTGGLTHIKILADD